MKSVKRNSFRKKSRGIKRKSHSNRGGGLRDKYNNLSKYDKSCSYDMNPDTHEYDIDKQQGGGDHLIEKPSTILAIPSIGVNYLSKGGINLGKTVVDCENVVNNAAKNLVKIRGTTPGEIYGKVISGIIELYDIRKNDLLNLPEDLTKIKDFVKTIYLNSFDYITHMPEGYWSEGSHPKYGVTKRSMYKNESIMNNLNFEFAIDFKTPRIRNMGVGEKKHSGLVAWHRDGNVYSKKGVSLDGADHMALIYYNPKDVEDIMISPKDKEFMDQCNNPNIMGVTPITHLCTLNEYGINKSRAISVGDSKQERDDCDEIIFNDVYGNAGKSYIAYDNYYLSHRSPKENSFNNYCMSGIVRMRIKII